MNLKEQYQILEVLIDDSIEIIIKSINQNPYENLDKAYKILKDIKNGYKNKI